MCAGVDGNWDEVATAAATAAAVLMVTAAVHNGLRLVLHHQWDWSIVHLGCSIRSRLVDYRSLVHLGHMVMHLWYMVVQLRLMNDRSMVVDLIVGQVIQIYVAESYVGVGISISMGQTRVLGSRRTGLMVPNAIATH